MPAIRRAWPPTLFLAGLFLFSASAGAAMPAETGRAAQSAPKSSEQQPVTERALSVRQALLLAKSLVEQGQTEAAEKFYDVLRSNRNEDIRIEAAFQLAHIRLRQGKYRQAISLFHEILNSNPDLARVRLDLARAYFLDKNYADATFQFELVKGGDLPPEVLANVDGFLDAIRRQKDWTLNFALSPVSDSNLNQASGGREECIDTVWGRLCRPLDDQASGMGLSFNASADYFQRFHQDWGLHGSLGFYGVAYEEEDYNDYMLYGAVGPRYLWGSGEASLQSTFSKRWAGNKEYHEQYGLRTDGQQIYKRILLKVGASIASVRYDDAYTGNLLDGPTWDVYLQSRYILTDQTIIQAGLDFMREETKERAYSNDNWRYSIGLYHTFAYGISLFVEGSLTRTSYKAPQGYVTSDNRLGETTRKDNTWRLLASLSSNVFEKYGITPILQYTYTKNESNIWTREYDRHRLSMLFNYKF